MRRACDAWAVSAGGRVSRAASGAAAGAGAGAAARGGRSALRYRAVLPLLAAYSAAHTDKIRARDTLHASYVSGNNTTDELHNRLEQASEAIRSELSDWLPKTRAEIKAILLELADRQVNIHTQTLIGWENALKMSTEDVSQMFKTVSKSAVQNLSPSKSRQLTPNETERDFDDFDDNDSEDLIQDSNSRIHITENEITHDDERIPPYVNRIPKSNSIDGTDERIYESDERIHNSNVRIQSSDDRIQESNDKIRSPDDRIQECDERIQLSNDSDMKKENSNSHNDSGLPEDVLDDNTDKETSKNSKISDPLSDFFEVDLS